MTISVALLRGINVGGKHMIKMAELKRTFEALGLGRVQTYIQSGNVLFASDEDAAALRPRLEEAVQTAFGFPVTIVVRTAAELEQVLAHCPFPTENLPEGESIYVALLAEAPPQTGVDRLQAVHSDIDEYRLTEREVYLRYRQPSHKSLFTNALLEKKLGVRATTRNWQTMTQLVRLAQEMA